MLFFSELLIKEVLKRKMERITVMCRLYLRVVQRDLSGKKQRKKEIHVDMLVKCTTCSGWFSLISQIFRDSPRQAILSKFLLVLFFFHCIFYYLKKYIFAYLFIAYLTLPMHTQRHQKVRIIYCSLPSTCNNVWQIENTQSTFTE